MNNRKEEEEVSHNDDEENQAMNRVKKDDRSARIVCMGSSNSYSPYPSHCFTLTITIFFFLIFVFPTLLAGTPIYNSFIVPNFTASYIIFIDNKGTFLDSPNHAFAAQIINLRPELRSFYLVVTHVSSGAIVWSANRNTPISESSQLHFSKHGLTLHNDRGQPIWSTPEIMLSSISSLHLLDSGNLILVDVENNIFWESFDHPTDVIVEGQRLKVGNSLVSSLSEDDLAEGNYKLVVGNGDSVLRWNEMNYWKFSMQDVAFRDTNIAVEYMMFNFSGVYLMGDNGTQVVISIILNNSDDVLNNSSYFGIAKLFKDGVFRIVRTNEKEYRVPDNACRIPFICGKLGLCSYGGACGCVPPFYTEFQGCLPKDGFLANARLVYFPLYSLEMQVEGRYLELVDPKLKGQVASEEVEKFVRVALCCLHEEPNSRPSMADVVGMLEGWMPLGKPRIRVSELSEEIFI